MASVAELLNQSRAAHADYRQHQPKYEPTSKHAQPGHPALALAALRTAASTRTQAHLQDPQHDDPAWADDPVPHTELIHFYAQQLAKLS